MLSLKEISSIFALTFAILILGQIGMESYLSTWYMLDNESFEQEYCENLDLPDIMCHGSCAIDELVNTTSNENFISNKQFKLSIEYLVPVEFVFLQKKEEISDQIKIFFKVNNAYTSPFLEGVYLPPISA